MSLFLCNTLAYQDQTSQSSLGPLPDEAKLIWCHWGVINKSVFYRITCTQLYHLFPAILPPCFLATLLGSLVAANSYILTIISLSCLHTVVLCTEGILNRSVDNRRRGHLSQFPIMLIFIGLHYCDVELLKVYLSWPSLKCCTPIGQQLCFFCSAFLYRKFKTRSESKHKRNGNHLHSLSSKTTSE